MTAAVPNECLYISNLPQKTNKDGKIYFLLLIPFNNNNYNNNKEKSVNVNDEY